MASSPRAAREPLPARRQTRCARFADAAPLAVDAPALVRASRLSAKVDNTALQDGYQLYHHAFFFTRAGAWAVVQQGMNDANSYARRYHWHSPTMPAFVNEPHSGIAAQQKSRRVLNIDAEESGASRRAVTELLNQGPDAVARELALGRRWTFPPGPGSPLRTSPRGRVGACGCLRTASAGFENVLEVRGWGEGAPGAGDGGGACLRSSPGWRDPGAYSFAPGGKDGLPYPVDRPTYDGTVAC